jgi:hypothetical protein
LLVYLFLSLLYRIRINTFFSNNLSIPHYYYQSAASIIQITVDFAWTEIVVHCNLSDNLMFLWKDQCCFQKFVYFGCQLDWLNLSLIRHKKVLGLLLVISNLDWYLELLTSQGHMSHQCFDSQILPFFLHLMFWLLLGYQEFNQELSFHGLFALPFKHHQGMQTHRMHILLKTDLYYLSLDESFLIYLHSQPAVFLFYLHPNLSEYLQQILCLVFLKPKLKLFQDKLCLWLELFFWRVELWLDCIPSIFLFLKDILRNRFHQFA